MSEKIHHPQPSSSGWPKLPARYAGIVMPFLLSLFMTAIVSLISTLRSVGLHEGVVRLWLGSWGLSWLVAFPVLFVVLPVVRRITAAVVDVSGGR
jgi:hypothetical protein